MADTPPPSPNNEALLREVDDAVRQDRLTGFWNRYGRVLIGLIILGVAAFGGWLYWDHHSKQASGEMAEQAQEVLKTLANGNTPDPAKLSAMAAADQTGYRAMALFGQAGQAAQKGDVKAAARLYADIAANEDLPKPYRDLGTIRHIALNFETLKPEDVVTQLKGLAVEGNPWFGSAGEMTAIAYMKMKKPELAGPIFAAIAKDEQAPETLRSRARQMAGLLGVDAVDTEDSAGEDQDQNDESSNASTVE